MPWSCRDASPSRCIALHCIDWYIVLVGCQQSIAQLLVYAFPQRPCLDHIKLNYLLRTNYLTGLDWIGYWSLALIPSHPPRPLLCLSRRFLVSRLLALVERQVCLSLWNTYGTELQQSTFCSFPRLIISEFRFGRLSVSIYLSNFEVSRTDTVVPCSWHKLIHFHPHLVLYNSIDYRLSYGRSVPTVGKIKLDSPALPCLALHRLPRMVAVRWHAGRSFITIIISQCWTLPFSVSRLDICEIDWSLVQAIFGRFNLKKINTH